MSLTVTGFLKHTEVDSFEHGCDPSTAKMSSFDMRITAETVAELRKRIADSLCCKPDEVTLNACDEPGRIDVEITETAAGFPATPMELGLWKKGRRKLWAATYSCQVQHTTPAGWLAEAA